MEGGDEAKLLNQVARAFPSVTAVRVKDAIDTVSDLLGKMLAAIRGANALTLLHRRAGAGRRAGGGPVGPHL